MRAIQATTFAVVDRRRREPRDAYRAVPVDRSSLLSYLKEGVGCIRQLRVMETDQ